LTNWSFSPREAKPQEVFTMKKLELIKNEHRPDADGMPGDLGSAGQSLWRRILAEFQIEDAAGREVLAQCCHAADLAVRLRQLVDKDGAVVGTKSGLKENPAARLELAARAFICRTLGKLGVLSEPLRDGPGRPPTFGGV
jgi:hypothetical protein